MVPYFQIFVVSAVVMGLSHTIAKEKIFEGLRTRLGGKETFFGYLVSCPFCASHWLAFVLVPLTGTKVVSLAWDLGVVGSVVEWFLSSVFVVVIAAFLRIAFYFVDESQGLLRREIAKTEAEVKVAKRVAANAESAFPSEPPRVSQH